MVNYKCLRCGLETKIKSRLIDHLKRKFTCKPTIANISVKDVYNSYFKDVSTNVTKCNPNVNKASTNDRNFKCKYCDSQFNSRQGKWRHEKNNCSNNKIQVLTRLLAKTEKEKDKQINDLIKNRDDLLRETKEVYEQKLIIYLEVFQKELAKKDKTIYSLVEELKNNPKTINNHKNLNLNINFGYTGHNSFDPTHDETDLKDPCQKLLTLSQKKIEYIP